MPRPGKRAYRIGRVHYMGATARLVGLDQADPGQFRFHWAILFVWTRTRATNSMASGAAGAAPERPLGRIARALSISVSVWSSARAAGGAEGLLGLASPPGLGDPAQAAADAPSRRPRAAAPSRLAGVRRPSWRRLHDGLEGGLQQLEVLAVSARRPRAAEPRSTFLLAMVGPLRGPTGRTCPRSPSCPCRGCRTSCPP